MKMSGSTCPAFAFIAEFKPFVDSPPKKSAAFNP